ncbi:YihY/virulence factor BrkB family protein [Notoacmeibacter sp. MSK16QG-6]|uniref:YihY/virulence factor BrkB family protein n=1 Tax=Notoacmeibacter sp. MSK16QG-6 TaxID=2957982 RepID=UPI00209DB491|nr:YihY/virulence factor BrkB family protein [Notoacmeibacter sp. MSK16QG-6]
MRVYEEITGDRVLLVAAGVTFYLLLALVPALSALVSVYGLFTDATNIQEQVTVLSGFIPGGGMEILEEQMSRLASQEDATLGLTFIISLGLALWSANAGMKSIFEGMNVAYDEVEKRGFIKLTLVSLLFTVCFLVSMVAVLTLVLALPALVAMLNLPDSWSWVAQIAGYVLLAVAVSLGIAAIYRWGPSRANARWEWITPGMILSLIVLAVMSVLFTWYAANFAAYNETYGSLGAIIGFMTWIWLATAILMIGAELNAELEHQTSRDTTTSPREPMGERGAVVADRVAGGSDRTGGRSRSDRSSQNGAPHDGEAVTRKQSRRPSASSLWWTAPAMLTLYVLQRRRENNRR